MYNNRFKKLSTVFLGGLLIFSVTAPVVVQAAGRSESAYINELYAALEKKKQKSSPKKKYVKPVGFFAQLKHSLIYAKDVIVDARKEIIQGFCAAVALYKIGCYAIQERLVDPREKESLDDKNNADAEMDFLFNNAASLNRAEFRAAVERLRNEEYGDISDYKKEFVNQWHPDKVHQHGNAEEVALYNRYFVMAKRELEIHIYELKKSGKYGYQKKKPKAPDAPKPGLDDMD